MSLKVIHCRDNSKHHVLAAATTGFVNSGGSVGVLPLLDHVKGEIRSRLPDGIPYVDTIADAVGLQRWTMQRRLANYGLNFSEVIDLVRRELAEQHIRQVPR